MKEVWKPVANFTDYMVSNLGRVKSIDRVVKARSRWGGQREMIFKGRILKIAKCSNGYQFITVCKNGVTKNLMVHRVVAEAFVTNPLNKPHVNHIDGVKYNNVAENLEWVTAKENAAHAISTGLTNMRGANNPYAVSVTVEGNGIKKKFDTIRMAATYLKAKEVTIAASRIHKRLYKGYKIY